MQTALDDSLLKVRKRSGKFWENPPLISTWNQDAGQET